MASSWIASTLEYGFKNANTVWNYTGVGDYESPDYDGYIKVDKGSPDKAKYVIFYAILEEKDPIIFCKTKKQLNIELKKLMKRKDVDQKSIRVFTLSGGVKAKKKK